MKLSKTSWLILGIGIFVIAFGSLYMVYSQQGGEQQQLNDSLLVAQDTSAKFVSQKESWESQLTQWESQLTQLESELTRVTSLLDETEASFPESVESIEYDEELFKIADDCNLDMTRLTVSESGDKEVEGITYSVASFEVAVKGAVVNILNFINTIATDEDFTNATVEAVNMIGEKDGPSSATIKLVIYGYKGE